MTVWVAAQDTDFCNTWWEERLFNAVVGVIYVFCFFNMKEGKSRWRAAFYYAVSRWANLHSATPCVMSMRVICYFINDNAKMAGILEVGSECAWCNWLCV